MSQPITLTLAQRAPRPLRWLGILLVLGLLSMPFLALLPASHPLVVMAPGWIRTELGGADAPLTIEETIPRLVNVLLDKRQRPGLEYLDYQGRTVPW